MHMLIAFHKFATDSLATPAPGTIQSDLIKYILELRNFNAQQATDPMEFWRNRQSTYKKLAPVSGCFDSPSLASFCGEDFFCLWHADYWTEK